MRMIGKAILGASKSAVPVVETQLDHILVTFNEDDPDDPFNWSQRRKQLVSAVTITMILLCCAGSISYSWCLTDIQSQFQVSREIALLGLGIFTFGFGTAPMVFAPLSEVYGRTPLYLVTYSIYVLLFIPQALTNNFSALVICRFLSGVFGSSSSSMVGGTLADMYRAEDRGWMMGLFSAGTMYGFALGSILPAYVTTSSLSYRWVFWIYMIISACHLLVLYFVLKETRAGVILSRRAARLRRETGDDRYRSLADLERQSFLDMVKISVTRPFVFLFTELAVAAYSIWLAFAWGVLFLFLEAIPLVFQNVYGWSYQSTSLAFLALVVGSTVALAVVPIQDKLYTRSAQKRPSGRPLPEARLYCSILGSFTFSAGLFVFAWCADTSVHFIGCLVGIAMSSFGIFTIYLAVFNVLADSYGTYASSALAAQSFARNMYASTFPFFALQLYNALGYHWASTLCGILALLLSAVPIVLYLYGNTIRAGSKYASADM